MMRPEERQEIEDFLYEEAALLDAGRLDDWLDLLTDDVSYRMPVRLTRERGKEADHSTEMQFFWDDRVTLTLRVRRLRTEFAWAEDPPSRTRHHVSNVRISATRESDEREVRSYVLIYRNRGEAARHDLISGERTDTLRRVNGAWKLARRVFLVDQTTLETPNLAILV